jgi:hypothetical protein
LGGVFGGCGGRVGKVGQVMVRLMRDV